MRPGQIYDVAATILQQRLSQLKGVGQVLIVGSSSPAVRIELNPTQLNNLGIGLEDVRAFLGSANANRPKGQLSDASHAWSLGTTDQLMKASEYIPLVIAYQHGAPVTLSDVATVTDSIEDIRTAGFANGKAGIVLLVFRQPRANVVETV